jgi:two-component system, NarL family, sensor kinase
MKFLLKYFFSLLMMFVSALHSSAQTHRIDSLENELKKLPKDSILAPLYTALANDFYPYDTIKADKYLEKGFVLAKKMNWDYAIGDNYQVKAQHKQFTGDNELAHLLFDSAIFYFENTINSKLSDQEIETAALAKATALSLKADILLKRGKSAEAIAIYLSTMEAYRVSNDPRKDEAVAIYYSKIAWVYYELKQFDKAVSYNKLSLAAILKTNNEESIAWLYLYVCEDFIQLNQIDSCLPYLAKAKPIVMSLNNHHLNVQYYNRLAVISSKKKDYRTAISYYEKALAETKALNDKFYILAIQREIGVCYARIEEYKVASKYLLTALPAAIAGNYAEEKMKIFQELATVAEKTNNKSAAYDYLKQAVQLRDSINLDNSKKAVAEIENKYQAAEKEKEIVELNADKQIQSLSIQRKSTLNYILFISLAALLIAAILGYRNFRNRQQLAKQQDELQQQRIRELEKDKQLVAVDAMLQGQEEERSRLAKDLHDGLGGLLSGVKFSLSNMKDNLIITPDNMTVFERSLDMLDTSIKELRRVAHNMMPELLTKFGLDEALKEYCNSINATNLLSVKYQSIGMDTRIEKSSEIIIYRIIQELLNNIMKHAAAKEATVQLVKEEGRLSIIVEDDGKGFDTALIKNNKGAGLTSIQSRVDYLKGQLDIHSETGKGTLVNIEFNI